MTTMREYLTAQYEEDKPLIICARCHQNIERGEHVAVRRVRGLKFTYHLTCANQFRMEHDRYNADTYFDS